MQVGRGVVACEALVLMYTVLLRTLPPQAPEGYLQFLQLDALLHTRVETLGG